MKNVIRLLLAGAGIVAALSASGCSSVPRTKWTDPVMRIMIDPSSIPADHYVRIQNALVGSHKWVVIDRGTAFKALKREQELIHQDEPYRFEDREKWARWAHMYSVGGIVVAHVQCQIKPHWLLSTNYSHCQEFLSIVNATTGEVIATAEDEVDSDLNEYSVAVSWDDAVAKLNAAYPKHYEPNKDHPILENYRELSAEEAQRVKESK